jgi:hypothetical protein
LREYEQTNNRRKSEFEKSMWHIEEVSKLNYVSMMNQYTSDSEYVRAEQLQAKHDLFKAEIIQDHLKALKSGPYELVQHSKTNIEKVKLFSRLSV